MSPFTVGFLFFSALPWSALGVDAGSEANSNLKEMHRGKAGIYLRLTPAQSLGDDARAVKPNKGKGGRARPNPKGGNKKAAVDLLPTHPLLDAVVMDISWRQLEPQRGVFNFDALTRQINHWGSAGKGVVICLILYGQSVDDAHTPPWVYSQPGVRTVSFHGGGTAKGAMIRTPVVWDPGFEKNVEPLIAALAKAFDGNKAVWYIKPGFGHIGNLTAQPSKEGGPTYIKAGFTPEKWGDYCRRSLVVYRRHFLKTPLLLMSPAMMIRDRQRKNFENEAGQLMKEFGNGGMAIVHYDLEDDRARVARALQDLSAIAPAAAKGITRIGIGDDWPLWVPESRRNQQPTVGFDDNHLHKVLNWAFGGVDGLPALPITILNCQLPEMDASHPKSSDFRPGVATALQQARERLKKNDEAIFGAR